MKPQPRYKPGDKIGGHYWVYQAHLGGMSEVYLCLDTKQELPIALKTFQNRFAISGKLQEVLENEIGSWIKLEQHPNIVRCFSAELLDNRIFMMLEWVFNDNSADVSLRKRLQKGPIELKEALRFIIEVCQGLVYACEKVPSLVHRDLKPENILISQSGTAKITDFGLSKVIKAEGLDNSNSENVTGQDAFRQSNIAGTPLYMAPEQWLGENLDNRTDVYAIGCILYETIGGIPPFYADSLGEIRRQHLEKKLYIRRLFNQFHLN